MSKMKELEQVAEFMATTAKETLMQNAEWALSYFPRNPEIEELEGDDYYDALKYLVSKTIEILYKQNETTTG